MPTSADRRPAMPRVWAEVETLAHAGYRRHGGKQNRRQQVRRIHAVVAWIDAMHQVGSIHRIGQRHIIDWYRHHRHLSAATLARGYYPAIVTLWRWLGRPDEPPRPRITPTTLQEDTTS